MAITKNLIKRMSDPNSVKPEQHKHFFIKPEEIVVNSILDDVEIQAVKIEDVKDEPVIDSLKISPESMQHIDNKFEEILCFLRSLNDKYENVKTNIELLLSDIQKLNAQMVDLKTEKPSFLTRLFKWRQ